MNTSRQLFSSLVIVVLFSNAAQGATQYALAGTATRALYDIGSGATLSTRTATFDICRDGRNWWISVRWQDEDIDQVQVSTDSTNIYILHSFSSVIERAKRKGEFVGSNVASGRVFPGQLPRLNDPLFMILWFAYLSDSYLEGVKDDRLPPIEVLPVAGGRVNTATPQKCDVERFASAPRLPRTAVFWDTGTLTIMPPIGDDATSGGARRMSWHKPYNEGFTNGIFAADMLTNANGVSVPCRSTFNSFAPKANGASCRDLALRASTDITLHHVTPRCTRMTCLPDLCGPTAVQDRRFSELPPSTRVRPFEYFITNVWLSEAEIRKLPVFREAKAATRMERHRVRVVRPWLIALCVLCVLPLVWLARRRTVRQSAS